ncbi:MAG: NAD-binding protein [Candidatus Marinimicrobia bacterium]|nr:NAD-binding protein [Candidatus Neomarinimicrobiota bacterium]
MRLWIKQVIRNSFFQIGAGIFIVMMVGGWALQYLETGAITQNETPYWWTIVTMTTVGYGDFAPETVQGRIFAVIIMFAGIALISMLTATISSIFVAQRIREGKGLEKINVQNHIIICGWNSAANQIIESLEYLMGSNPLDVVLINQLPEDQISRLKSKYRKIHIHYVSGDYTQEQILQKANLRHAETVVILPNLLDPTITSPDEKTILATLTVKSLEPNVRVVAYITEPENMTHLKRANADEVVLSDDLSSFIVASHIVDPGIPQIVSKLLDNRSPSRFKRVEIPKEYIGKSFNDLFTHFRSINKWILVGLYSEDENLGIGEILTSDSSALDAFIERKLKEGGIPLNQESRVNTVINPDDSYEIKEGEGAIVIP